MTYAVRFDYPEADAPLYAGMHKGAFGWAPTLATALMYDNVDDATRVLENAYGEGGRTYGRVITVKAGYPTET